MVAMQIRRSLRKHGFTYEDFAEKLGVDVITVKLWLSGKYDFNLSTLAKVQEILDIEIVKNWYTHKN